MCSRAWSQLVNHRVHGTGEHLGNECTYAYSFKMTVRDNGSFSCLSQRPRYTPRYEKQSIIGSLCYIIYLITRKQQPYPINQDCMQLCMHACNSQSSIRGSRPSILPLCSLSVCYIWLCMQGHMSYQTQFCSDVCKIWLNIRTLFAMVVNTYIANVRHTISL